jgi:hypothetical protein
MKKKTELIKGPVWTGSDGKQREASLPKAAATS